MSKIAISDESSTPVIDWEKEEKVLHITDPFFAFFPQKLINGEADWIQKKKDLQKADHIIVQNTKLI